MGRINVTIRIFAGALAPNDPNATWRQGQRSLSSPKAVSLTPHSHRARVTTKDAQVTQRMGHRPARWVIIPSRPFGYDQV